MKTILVSCLAVAAAFTFPSCTTVEERPVVQTTTTTTEETVRHPVGATTETRTVRSY